MLSLVFSVAAMDVLPQEVRFTVEFVPGDRTYDLTESSYTSGWVLWIVTSISSFSRHPGLLVESEFLTFPIWQIFGQHGMNFLTLQCNIICMLQIPV